MDKRKRTCLTINQKLEVIKYLESGVPVSRICNIYGIRKQTVSDIKKNKDKLNNFMSKCDESDMNPRKRMKMARETTLEEALLKWYVQQRSNGVQVQAIELKSAAIILAHHLNIVSFKADDGWLWRFRKRHGILNKRIDGEVSSTSKEVIDPFRLLLLGRIKTEMLLQAQIYNADETSLLWRSLPENTQAFKHDKSSIGKIISNDRISALLCTNAQGSHKLTPVIVGQSRNPRVLKNIMNCLPVSYYNSKNALFNSNIFKHWFFEEFVPAVRKFQEEELAIQPEDVKCLLLLDNASAHSSENILCSEDGKFSCMFLPKDTSIIQPMEQGIILATKRIYRKKFINEIMAEVEENEEDTREQRTLENLKRYSLKSAIFNFASAWEEVNVQTIENAWRKLFSDQEPVIDLEGLEVPDFCKTIQNNAGEEVAKEDILEWLEIDEDDSEIRLNENEMADDAMFVKNDDESEEENNEEEETKCPKIKLSTVRSHLEDLITFIDDSSDNEIQPYYTHFRNFRELIIKKQRTSKEKIKHEYICKTELPKPSASTSYITMIPEVCLDVSSEDD